MIDEYIDGKQSGNPPDKSLETSLPTMTLIHLLDVSNCSPKEA